MTPELAETLGVLLQCVSVAAILLTIWLVFIIMEKIWGKWK